MAANTKTKPVAEEAKDYEPTFEPNPKKAGKSADKGINDIETDLNKAERKGGRGKLIFIFVILLLVGLAIAIGGFNAFGVRDKYVYGFLKNVPIVKNIIPAPKTEDDPYAGLTNEQLILQLEGMQTQLDNKDAEIKSLNDKSDSYVKDLTRLKKIEEYQLDVKAQKQEFDRMIALNDPAAYQSFYESISPDNAEKLYIEVVANAQFDKDLKNYVNTFSAMDESEAATLLEAMISADMEKVVLILKNINVDSRAAILGKFTPANGARVARMLAPTAP